MEREIAQWVPPWRIDPKTHRTMSEHLAPPIRPATAENQFVLSSFDI